MYISNDMVLFGDIPFFCESQPRRVSCLLVDSSKMHIILAKLLAASTQRVNCSLCHFIFLKSWSLLKQTFVRNRTHNLRCWLQNLLMSLKNHKGYLRIGESLIIKSILVLILSVNDVTDCMPLSMRNLKDSRLTFTNRDWSVCLIVFNSLCCTHCYGSETLWFYSGMC